MTRETAPAMLDGITGRNGAHVRRLAMLTRHHDHTCRLASVCAPLLQRANQSYYAEVPALALDEQSRLVDQVMRFAFETLGVRHLEVRVFGAELASLAGPTSTHGCGSAR